MLKTSETALLQPTRIDFDLIPKKEIIQGTLAGNWILDQETNRFHFQVYWRLREAQPQMPISGSVRMDALVKSLEAPKDDVASGQITSVCSTLGIAW
ncbi:hypothetical protein Baya_8954 [Bagarius yarrelli]|uniref:Uncharacterized protein n=1 Tax=Bagarius yarrelli TaxID=175774 RepID=A0A556U7P6_BAGYA|nr:hypothetical protein Baya_8954 [Bagarius yarrelli]